DKGRVRREGRGGERTQQEGRRRGSGCGPVHHRERPEVRRRRQLHRLRQVPRRRAGCSRGPQPAHGREHDDRRQQGPALHGGIRPQEGDQV
ncbi:MAG: DNA-binding protein HU-beta, partial [uncultured Solirubrobacteraceae bacterium]